MEEIETLDDLEVGAKVVYENESSTSWVETTSITKTISTSAAPEYVGAQGDVYIGNSTNLLFGKGESVDLFRQDDGTFKLGQKESICTGEQVAGFRDPATGHVEEVMLLRTPEDLEQFRKRYGIDGEIEKIY